VTESCHKISLPSHDQNQQSLIRVIGIGSSHGVDQVGWLVCDRLQATVNGENVDWKWCRTPTQLPQLIQDCAAVVIIDAILSEHSTGQVICLAWPLQQNHYQSVCSSHAINVIEALQLAETLEQLPSHTYLLGLTVTSRDENATSVVDNAIPQIEHELTRIVDRVAEHSSCDL
jgi:hydrogenase maturation protease